MRTATGLAALALTATLVATGTVQSASSPIPSEISPEAQSCKVLPDILKKVLAAGVATEGKAIEIADLYSEFYPTGANPSAEQLYAVIPASAFEPKDDRDGAILGSGGWDKDAVIADDGYGEQSKSTYAKDGGLPSFCRVGGTVRTSETSKSQFEVWMPVADTPAGKDAPAPEACTSIDGVDVADVAKTFKCVSTSGWSKRLVFSVGGGLRGAVAYPEMKQTMSRYHAAVAGTNMGHFGAQDGITWLPANPEAWTDYGHRAVHFTSRVAQQAVRIFYDAQPHRTSSPNSSVATIDAKKQVFYTYFKGCSTGGRAAMASAQRYPKDFDGIIAGSPAFDFNNLKAYQIHVNSFLANNKSEGYIPTEAYPLINSAVLKTCDSADGVEDNVISKADICKPDFAALIGCSKLGIKPYDDADKAPEPAGAAAGQDSKAPAADSKDLKPAEVPAKEKLKVLLARRDTTSTDPVAAPGLEATKKDDASATPAEPNGEDAKGADAKGKDKKDKDAEKGPAPKCLTDPQLETLANIFKPYTIDNELISEGVLPSSVYGWQYINAVTGKFGSSPVSWFQFEVLGEKDAKAKFNATEKVTPEVIKKGQQLNPGGTITFDTDLSGFFNAGGKLLHYHGLDDSLVPPMASRRYYDQVLEKVGDKARSAYKLYLIPGMLHCRGGNGCFNFGGAGQEGAGNRPRRYDATHDMFLALTEWVEKGVAPNVLIGAAYKTKEGTAPQKFSDDTPYSNGVRLTRPLCPWPTAARLKGKGGDTNDAGAFECA